MAETVGNQNRINKSVNRRVGSPGVITASTAGAAVPASTSHIEVTPTATATDSVKLADAPTGFVMTGLNAGATAFKIKATGTVGATGTGSINGVDCTASAGASIPAGHAFHALKTSKGWNLQAFSALGAVVAVVPA